MRDVTTRNSLPGTVFNLCDLTGIGTCTLTMCSLEVPVICAAVLLIFCFKYSVFDIPHIVGNKDCGPISS